MNCFSNLTYHAIQLGGGKKLIGTEPVERIWIALM